MQVPFLTGLLVSHFFNHEQGRQMKQSILLGSLAMVVCLAGSSIGQEKTGAANALPANQEQLKALTYFLGTWDVTGEINMAGQPSVPIVCERQFKWDLHPACHTNRRPFRLRRGNDSETKEEP